ncbi:hypothetical protein RFI_29912 [Reticulomyxa filosa]|uniref:Uncharacterized protein n=1 Tax=Reticulomyxa filosa TaxID=46433 RepID=X6M381_RETFI|nr:hypothetical protein RFI_29912 [Reticulomyxa filosa]|eukprot:ETO07480.1 hypothetical protein RFI_29912 [Reticulomyxa filosa]
MKRLFDFIDTMFTDINGIYEQQLNIYISIGDVFMGNVPFFSFNDAPQHGAECCNCSLQVDVIDQLNKMTSWTNTWYTFKTNNCTKNKQNIATCTSMDTNAAWILLSKCGSGGHIFGAQHSFENGTGHTGGIMDYGTGIYHGTYQFHPFRKTELCSGITWSMQSGRRSRCWSVKDYGNINYRWRQTGRFGECKPCGDFTYSIEELECVMSDKFGQTYITYDTECNLALKPQAKIISCDSTQYPCPNSICGNALLEWDEECDIALDNECCNKDCTRISSPICNSKNPIIDCAFIDSNGYLFLFQQGQFSKYSNGLNQLLPDIGYPQLITTGFPIQSWSGDFDACFSTSQDIVYIFKYFSYVRIDLNKPWNEAQIDPYPINLTTTSEFGIFSDTFLECGNIDAAFIINDLNGIFICQSIYYQFTIGSNNGFELFTRPFWQDFSIQFSTHLSTRYTIDTAIADPKTGIIRFYLADQHLDFHNGQQLYGSLAKNIPMGYWSLISSTCIDINCKYCDNSITAICITCQKGFILQNDKCYNISYLVILNFDQTELDIQYINMKESIVIYNNTITPSSSSSSTGNSLYLQPLIAVVLFPPDLSHYINHTIYQFTYTIDIYPKFTIQYINQTLFTIINHDLSKFILQLQFSSKCHGSIVQLIYQTSKNQQYFIFNDQNCGIFLTYYKWNKLTVQTTITFVKITVNGVSQTVTIPIQSFYDLSIDINQWFFGYGFLGFIDNFIFQVNQPIYNHSQSTKSNSITINSCIPPVFPWFTVIAIGATILVVYTAVLIIIAYYLYTSRLTYCRCCIRSRNYHYNHLHDQTQLHNYDNNNNNNNNNNLVPPPDISHHHHSAIVTENTVQISPLNENKNAIKLSVTPSKNKPSQKDGNKLFDATEFNAKLDRSESGQSPSISPFRKFTIFLIYLEISKLESIYRKDFYAQKNDSSKLNSLYKVVNKITKYQVIYNFHLYYFCNLLKT